MIETLNQNAGAVTGAATIALLLVTAFYAWTTHRLFEETKTSRLVAGQPRVVAYLRVHEVHSNIAQLHVANLSGAAATGVSAIIERETDWPKKFYFEDSKILRDLSYMQPHEVLKFDLGVGPDLFKDGKAAVFRMIISYAGLDGRAYSFDEKLRVESVEGHSHFQIYSVDDVARRLKEISNTLQGFTGFQRIKVDTYSSEDRLKEYEMREKQREEMRQRHEPKEGDKTA